METLEVHAKDFLVKWVNAPENCSVKWQVKSLKKSINFAIYRRNDLGSQENLGKLDEDSRNSSSPFKECNPNALSNLESLGHLTRLRSSSMVSVSSGIQKTKSRSSTFSANLTNSDLTLVKDYHKLVPEELVKGTFSSERGGTFAFIFDNSFSKTISKKVYFSAKVTGNESKPQSPGYAASKLFGSSNQASLDVISEKVSENILMPKNGELMQGILLKKRRKKLQGFTKRFFILNFKYGTLSYFKNYDNKLRGQMPISESIVSADSNSRNIFVDSGMEVWDLKALNEQDFNAWVNAFNAVKRNTSKLDEYARSAHLNHETKLVSKLEELRLQIDGLISRVPAIAKNDILPDLEKLNLQVEDLLSYQKLSDSTSIYSDNEFYDARENIFEAEGVILMDDQTQEPITQSEDELIEDNDALLEKSSSDSDSDSEELPAPTTTLTKEHLYDHSKGSVSDLYPLPLSPIDRDCDIPVCNHDPPSLLSFVRKNVGKDLSTISMPVDMNEPITILQKYAEILEYTELIDNALSNDYPASSGEFILRIAAFSVSYLSAMRSKVRCSRKPFNPLLGETFELVREDKGYRMICEKVSHRPPVFAMYAESSQWTLSFNPAPSQKFWGKTSEFYTSGTVKLLIKGTGELLTWSHPHCVLKNIIAGEKYTEPITNLVVKSSSGQKAIVEFAKSGMFSGRSEDLTIKAFDSSKRALPYNVSGKWTESMTLKTNSAEKQIWTAGKLLPESNKKFGFTEFAGCLNKITTIEKDRLPPNDSRLRPDMRAYEKGSVGEAESLKHKIEEGQRTRRKESEKSRNHHRPFFFRQVGGKCSSPETGEWEYISGDLSYWERRKNQNWSSIPRFW